MEMINQELINELAEELYESFASSSDGFIMPLPFSEICDVKVYCHLNIRLTYAVLKIKTVDVVLNEAGEFDCVDLYTENIYGGYDYAKNTRFNKDDISRILIATYKKIKSLRFDKYSGQFTEDGKIDKTVNRMNKLCKLFMNIETIKTYTDICCVCHEQTMTKTACGHHLCYVCWFRINQVENDDTGCMERPCPLCKKDI